MLRRQALRLPRVLPSCSSLPRRMLCTTTTTKSAPPTSLVQRARDFMAVDNRLSKLSHFSNMCCFFGLAQSDILALQSFMVVNSATNVMFNFLQQKPLLVPSSYSIIFTLLSSSVVVKIPVYDQEMELDQPGRPSTAERRPTRPSMKPLRE